MLCSLPHSDQLFKFLNQSISMTCTAFKRPTKNLGMHGLFILGLGDRTRGSFVVVALPTYTALRPKNN